MVGKYLRNLVAALSIMALTMFFVAAPGGEIVRAEAAAASAAKTAVVTAADGLNVRSGPGTSHAMAAHAAAGARLPITGVSGDWVRVKLASGQEGWVAGWLIRAEGSAAEATPPAAKTAVVTTTDGLNVRSGPGTDQTLITHVAPGTRLPVTGSSGEWVKVKLATGQEGWVAGWYVRVETPPTGTQAGAEEAVPPGTSVVVKDESLDIKSKPEADAATVACAMKNYELSVTARAGSWYQVGFAPDATGWVPGDGVTVVLPEPPSRGDGEKGSGSDTRHPGKSRPMPERMEDAVIVLDPGHGGGDPGATGPSGYQEKDFNLAVGLETARLLRAEGAEVVLTRETDIRLGANSAEDCGARSRIANEHEAHVFISIHANANLNREIQGTSVYYYAHPDNHTDCVELARALQTSLVYELERRDRGLFGSNLMVLRGIDMPGALVETAFISNPEEEALLRDPAFQKQAARGIVAGIKAYFES